MPTDASPPTQGAVPSYSDTMAARLQDLLDNPETYTPDYTKRYGMLQQHCEGLTAHSAYAMTILLGKDSSRGYTELPQHPQFEFPQVHTPDFGYQVGWHFFVGTATGEDGIEYGVQLMLWNYAQLPDYLCERFGLTPAQNQVAEVHLAISPTGDRHYRGAPVVVDGRSGAVDAGADPFWFAAGDSRIESTGGDFLPLHLVGHATDRSGDEPVELSVDLTLTKGKPVLLQGDGGAAPSVGGVGTLYYSIPRLWLAEGSTLTIGGREVRLMSGQFWFDHQWGTGFMPNGNPRVETIRAMAELAPSGPGGWDWFMAQFDGDVEITLASMHTNAALDHYNNDGPDMPGPMQAPVNGKWIDADGTAHEVSGTMTVDEWVRAERSPDPSLYPITNVWYPNRWTFSIDGDVPAPMREFTMNPIVDGGQAGYFAPGMQYSEGAVTVSSGGQMVGRGFAESVGYVTTPDAIMSVAGVPVTAENVAALTDSHVGVGHKVHAVLRLLGHQGRADLKQWGPSFPKG